MTNPIQDDYENGEGSAMADTQTQPGINDSWDEALGLALEDAGAWNLYESLNRAQRVIASDRLATWAEHADDGAPTPPSDPASDDHRSEVAEMRYQLRRAELKADTYREYVGNPYANKGLADAAVEHVLNGMTR